MSPSSQSRIQALQAKLDADPASKIFLPLAELHRKAGDLARAARVLQAGLKHNPGYHVAQVAYARVLLEQGDTEICRRLLSDLVKEVPDNLLAQKLLQETGGPLTAGQGAEQDDVEEPQNHQEDMQEPQHPEEQAPLDSREAAPAEDVEPALETDEDDACEDMSPADLLPDEAMADHPDHDGGPVCVPEPGPEVAEIPVGDDEPAESAVVETSDEKAHQPVENADAIVTAAEDACGEAEADAHPSDEDAHPFDQDEPLATPDAAYFATTPVSAPAAAVDAEAGADDEPGTLDDPSQSTRDEPGRSTAAEAATPVWPAGDDEEPAASETEAAENQPVVMEEDCRVDEAEDLGFHVTLDEDFTNVETDAGPHPDSAARNVEDHDLSAAAADSEAVWADPDVEPGTPPVPEPGVWKAEEEGAVSPHDDRDADGIDSSLDEIPEPVAAEGETDPFATMRLHRDQVPDEAPEVSAAGDDPHGDASPSAPEAEEADAIAMQDGGDPADLMDDPADLMDDPADGMDDPADGMDDPAEGMDETFVEPMTPSPEWEDEANAQALTPEPEHALLDDTAMAADDGLQDDSSLERSLNLARLYRRQGRLELATDAYQEVLNLDPEHPAARRELSELCGENVPEITDDDLIPQTSVFSHAVPVASAESLEAARQRKIQFLRAWLEHIREND